MLHPVGPLPAAVYWRRRLLVLTLLLSVLGGGGWAGYAVATGRFEAATTPAAATSSAAVTPALERVVPALAGVQLPAVPAATTTASSAPAAVPCSDDMIAVAARTPGTTARGTDTTFELVVGNVSPVPCLRSLDPLLQELVLVDAAGNRIWSSADCSSATGSDLRTLAPGQVVSFALEWSGLTSDPTCAAPRVPPPPGGYVLRARLGTKAGTDAPLTIA